MIPMSPTPQFSMNDPWLPLRLWILGVIVLGIAGLDLLEAEPPSLSRPEFALPQPGRIFEFPADHGSHPEYKIEWWYITGHLKLQHHCQMRFRKFRLQWTFLQGLVNL